MAGALYDIHTLKETVTDTVSSTTGVIQGGIFLPAGERLLSAFGYAYFNGAGYRALAIQKYEFGDIYGHEDSEGCWAFCPIDAATVGISGTLHLYAICAKETNPA